MLQLARAMRHRFIRYTLGSEVTERAKESDRNLMSFPWSLLKAKVLRGLRPNLNESCGSSLSSSRPASSSTSGLADDRSERRDLGAQGRQDGGQLLVRSRPLVTANRLEVFFRVLVRLWPATQGPFLPETAFALAGNVVESESSFLIKSSSPALRARALLHSWPMRSALMSRSLN